jgi:neutral ceramidase
MARSHIAVALSAALVASLIIAQLTILFGLPKLQFWNCAPGQTQSHDGFHQGLLTSEKLDGEAVQDPSQYLIGVGKADITG